MMEEDILEEVDKWPEISVTIERGKKHLKALLTKDGEKRLVVFSKSASDYRARKNNLTVVRRQIRSLLE